MTDEEIDALPAGREMDLTLASKVFRCKPCSEERHGQIDALCGCFYNDHGDDDRSLPHYSTDISAAWMLVRMFKITITPKTDPTPNSQWLTDVRLCSSQEPWLAYGNTAPLAICRAALKAVERETFKGIWTLPPDIRDALQKKFDR